MRRGAFVVLILMLLMAVFAPLIAPYDPSALSGAPLERPSAAHPLGTNDVGQDLLSELLISARVTLSVALGAALGTVSLALLVGGLAGYAGGTLDAALMRLVDVWLSLPRLPLLILVTALLGGGLVQITLMITLLSWPSLARVIRGQVQSVRHRPYVMMARHFGASPLYLFARHVIPQLVPLLVFGWVTSAAQAATMEAGLAFLGIGDPTAKSWGLMMRYALNLPGLLLTDRWVWWLLPPALCITVLILALTFIGLSLETRLDSRTEGR